MTNLQVLPNTVRPSVGARTSDLVGNDAQMILPSEVLLISRTLLNRSSMHCPVALFASQAYVPGIEGLQYHRAKSCCAACSVCTDLKERFPGLLVES